MKKQPRLIILDVIRTLAIFLVIGTHILQRVVRFDRESWIVALTQYGGIKDFFWISWAGFGVMIFIILSGMVLEYNYGQTAIQYLSFMYKRFKRIYLTYWLCLLITIPFWPSAAKIWHNITGLMVYTGEPWSHFLIPTAWFLGTILGLYLFFPWLSKLSRRWPIWTMLILLLVSIGSRYFFGQVAWFHRGIDSFPLSRIFEFGLGIWLVQQTRLVAFLMKLGQKINWSIWVWLSDVSFPAFLIHSVLLETNMIHPKTPFYNIPIFLGLTIFLSVVVYYSEKLLNQILQLKPKN